MANFVKDGNYSFSKRELHACVNGSLYICGLIQQFLKRSILLFSIQPESIMKIKTILRKYWIYFEEDIHSSNALLPGRVFHNLEVGTLSRFVIKRLNIPREHRYLCVRVLRCRCGSALQNKSWDLLISGKVLEGFW